MTKVAIVYHSGFGHTEVQAKAVADGAVSVAGTEVILHKADEISASPDVLNDADAIIFGSPTYMGSVSGPFKTFMDATAKIWFGQGWKDKVAGGFTNSGSMSGDKFNTLVQIVTFAAQHGMIWVPQTEMNESAGDDRPNGDPEAINRIGSFLGAMAQSDNAPADQTPPKGDLETARRYGARIAEAAKRWG